jgi:hypothetical protein
MLKDISTANRRPYSWSRVQLAWWTVIVLASFIAIMIKYHNAPQLNQSTLILLGISGTTIAAARVIDVNDLSNTAVRHQDENGSNFLFDILSDQDGVSIHRFQTVIFNFVFGIWFIVYVILHLTTSSIDCIMPVIEQNNLILLGLSSATYAFLKTTENKSATKEKATEEKEAETAELSEEPAVG